MGREKALTAEQENEIRTLYQGGVAVSSIGKRYGIGLYRTKRILGIIEDVPEQKTMNDKAFWEEWKRVTGGILKHYETRGNAVEKA